ncbi:ABC transporter permease [Sinomonas humi]|uniref:ABC transporter permease n=1 Tax=Sinomonas humi TaxID=1338436 RepID=UPI000691D6E0|nr:ABC transporter permease [Sinomonas humi]
MANPTFSGMAKKLGPRNISSIYLFAIILVWAAIVVPDLFFTDSTLTAILNNTTVVGLVAIGLTLPLASGVYDLSIGNLVAFSGVVAGLLNTKLGLPLPIVILLTLAVGALVGLFNALWIVKLKIFSLIATLGSGTILAGVTIGLSDNKQIVGISPDFLAFTSTQLFGKSLAVYYLFAAALLLFFFLEATPAGRYIYATGGNAEAARLAGVKTNSYMTLSLVVGSIIAAFAGILQVSIVGVASKDVGPGYLLPAFAAVFLGATQFRGGRFNVWGTLVVIVTLAAGVKVLELWTQMFWLDQVFYGSVLLIAVALATAEGRIAFGKRRRPPETPEPESAAAVTTAEAQRDELRERRPIAPREYA